MKLKKKLIIPIIGAYPDIGKGTLAATVGYILQKSGFSVTIAKFDGYFNLDSGNMNPYHKSPKFIYSDEEIFVLKDGYESDADHGYYERFLDKDFTSESCITNGKILNELLEKIKGKRYPFGEVLKYKHLRDLLKQKIYDFLKNFDVLVLEVGGTIGDEESNQLYNCLQEIFHEGKIDSKVIMVSTYLSNENKKEGIDLSSRTKITRKAFLEARNYGLNPDIIILRSHTSLLKNDVEYIASDCNLPQNSILIDPDVPNVYQIPEIIEKQGFMNLIFPNKKFEIIKFRLEEFNLLRSKVENENKQVLKIGIFGKTLYDSYNSLIEAVNHAGIENNIKTQIIWLDDLEPSKISIEDFDGIIISEGLFGIAEKIGIIKQAREGDIPLLAISFGCDLLVKEFIENKLNISASINEIEESSEFNIEKGPLRVGAEKTEFKEGSYIKKIYNSSWALERYRNCSYVPQIAKEILKNLEITGFNENSEPVIFELKENRFFIGVKFHPEYKSRPRKAHPLFKEFIKKCIKN